jgi:ATP-dependent helicase Lhr and Lhr-like helicase
MSGVTKPLSPQARAPVAAAHLPEPFIQWFGKRGWAPRAHQVELLARAQGGESVLLIAPTGAGKTLAGFLPSLVELSQARRRRPGEPPRGVHTLYVSPLKALAVDIERNLETPVAEMGLDVVIETRTGDTPSHKRQRQKLRPPDILLTTPEQLALMIAGPDAERFFSDLRFVVFDELHALVASKRGHLLALGLARLRKYVPDLRTVGLSATVSEPDELRRWLVSQAPPGATAGLVEVAGGAKPVIEILDSRARVPWAGHTARYAMKEIYEAIKAHRTTLLFVNTRSQAEMLFQELWRANDASLPIALHHGSLDAGQRRRVEAAMQRNELRAVVATSTLDLGIDWGDVDLVVHVGAPKGASRLAQRIGRSNHRMDEPSHAILVPANRFEVMECVAAVEANYLGAQDTPPLTRGSLDVLCQHILGCACAAPFHDADLLAEIRTAAPYADLGADAFARAVDFVATGGYSLRAYERYARIRRTAEGAWRLTHPRIAQQYRLNVGTIMDAAMLNVAYAKRGMAGRAGARIGQVEEFFAETLSPGDTFLFGGRVLRFEGMREEDCIVSNAEGSDAAVPYFGGSKFPLSTYLAAVVRDMVADPARWKALPRQVGEWLRIQQMKSALPRPGELLVETFPRGGRFHMVAYPFEGRLAHQTLGMLLTRRLQRANLKPMGFVATDYSLAIWGARDMGEAFDWDEAALPELFSEDMLGEDLEDWLADSYLLKRTFRQCAVIAGLIDRRHPGREKSGRQVTVSADLVFDVLRRHEPGHILLEATRADAAAGLLDIRRLGEMLQRIRGGILHKRLSAISPLAVPIMLEIGRERMNYDTEDELAGEAADELIAEAMRDA